MQRDKEAGDDEQISVGCMEVQLEFRITVCTMIAVGIRALDLVYCWFDSFVACIVRDDAAGVSRL